MKPMNQYGVTNIIISTFAHTAEKEFMKTYNFGQGTRGWFVFRSGSKNLGIPPKITASCFKEIIKANGEPVKPSRRDRYLETLANEYVFGQLEEKFVSNAMQEGRILEAEARAMYELANDCNVSLVGFCLHENGIFGYSPDGFVGDNGLIEIKCVNTSKQEKTIAENRLPPDHVQQCQGGLWITGFDWLDFYSYHNLQPHEDIERLEPFQFRVYPDKEYHVLLERELRSAQIILTEKIREKGEIKC